MEKTNRRSLIRLIVLLVLILLCLTYFFVPTVKNYVNEISAVLGSANVDAVVEFIRSYGPYAMIVSFLLMVFQSVLAPLPAFLITFANAAIFGWWQGAILLDQRHGGRCAVLLHCPSSGPGYGGKICRSGCTGQCGGLL